MKAILRKCDKADLNYISSVLDSYFSITNDKRRKELLADFPKNQEELIGLMDKQIRYYGSSDAAYLTRAVFGDDPGVQAAEIIEDICEKLKVKIKLGGSTEAMLERLVTQTVEKELASKSPEELSKAFEKIGIGNADRELIIKHIKTSGEVAILPIINQMIGTTATLGIIEAIAISMIAQFIGKEAAKALVREIIKRNPWLNSLGPALWALSGAWLAVDLQGPAFRKTVPIALYLGVVALRDGEELSVLKD